ncbi:hypothetical protein C4D60_Mb04t03880 [Musa balbisiana]|uniref:Uncharacterized protein n=1 Tax=Musa balbisiana TaxID=52838 RepID=A0A4S8K9F7_MUSBA|nr:hypothetical protein C4D60_Mb04t03880 [Musa balbisiana]
MKAFMIWKGYRGMQLCFCTERIKVRSGELFFFMHGIWHLLRMQIQQFGGRNPYRISGGRSSKKINPKLRICKGSIRNISIKLIWRSFRFTE